MNTHSLLTYIFLLVSALLCEANAHYIPTNNQHILAANPDANATNSTIIDYFRVKENLLHVGYGFMSKSWDRTLEYSRDGLVKAQSTFHSFSGITTKEISNEYIVSEDVPICSTQLSATVIGFMGTGRVKVLFSNSCLQRESECYSHRIYGNRTGEGFILESVSPKGVRMLQLRKD